MLRSTNSQTADFSRVELKMLSQPGIDSRYTGIRNPSPYSCAGTLKATRIEVLP